MLGVREQPAQGLQRSVEIALRDELGGELGELVARLDDPRRDPTPPRGQRELDAPAVVLAPSYGAALRSALDYDGALERIDCPVTVVWGARDRLLPAAQAARFAARIPHATARLLAGCGHVPMSDDAPLVARAILDAAF